VRFKVLVLVNDKYGTDYSLEFLDPGVHPTIRV